MSANQSNLAAYNVDLVVATTQAGISSTMNNYVSSGQIPPLSIYYTLGPAGNPQALMASSLAQLSVNAGCPVPDPLTLPAWNSSEPTTPGMIALANSCFVFAFSIQLGSPAGYNFRIEPGFISLNEDGQSVTFLMLCSEFTFAQANYNADYTELTALSVTSQPPTAPWTFEVSVPVSAIASNENLPADVQAQLGTLPPNAFGVQQLLLDYGSGKLVSIPQIPGVEPGSPVYEAIGPAFMQSYFNALQEAETPGLGYTIVSNSAGGATTGISSVTVGVAPYVNTADPNVQIPNLNTLNFLCALNNNALPAFTPFSWSWVDPPDIGTYDGAIAINANIFLAELTDALGPYVSSNCYLPKPTCEIANGIASFNDPFPAGGQATVTYNSAPNTLISYSFQSTPATAFAGGDSIPNASFMGDSQFSLEVTITPGSNVLTITQSLIVYAQLTVNNQMTCGEEICVGEPIVNTTYINTYNVGVSTSGTLAFSPSTTTLPVVEEAIPFTPSPQPAGPVNYAAFQQDLHDYCINMVFAAYYSFTPIIPLGSMLNCVFPGGSNFTYAGFLFSDSYDLVSYINYTNPTSN